MIARSTSVDRWVRISYTQQVNVNVNNPAPQAQRGGWKVTYTYNVTPTTPTVDPATCWTCSANSSGVVDVNFTGFTASESFLKNNNAGTQKYSFTLLDSLLQSRVLGVTAQLQKQNPDLSWSDIGSPIVFAPPSPSQPPLINTPITLTLVCSEIPLSTVSSTLLLRAITSVAV